jgi:membrane protein involved in colicin uptake
VRLARVLEAKKRAARLKAADTNKDGELSRAELEALHAKESQERADLFGTTDLGAALDAGKLNTSTDVSNGTDNTSTNFSDMFLTGWTLMTLNY